MNPSIAVAAAPRRWRTFLVTTLLMWMLTALWSQATPLMSVTDEPSHTIRAAAAARGEIVGEVGALSDRGLIDFQVPQGIADANQLTCTAWQSNTAADCQPDVADPVEPLADGPSSAGVNLPTYYVVVGWPSLLVGGEAGMWLMRLWSALLFAALVGIAAMQLRTLPQHRWALTGLAVGAIPTAVYIGGSLNPNGLEWAGAAALFATLLALGRTTSTNRELLERGAMVAVSAVLLVSARGVTPLWVALALVAALLAARSDILMGLVRRWQLWAAVGAAALLMGLSALWILRPPDYGIEGLPSDGRGESAIVGARLAWERMPLHWDQLVNWYGWQDTEGPAFSRLVLLTVLIGFALTGVALARRGLRVAAAMLVVAFVIVPIALSALLITDAGYIWLGRYMLAVVPLITITTGVALDERGVGASPIGETLRWWLLGTVGAVQVVSYIYILRRFSVGQDDSLVSMLLRPEWQPALMTIPSIGLTAIVVAACVLLVGRARDEAPGTAASGPAPTAAQARPILADRLG
ncbi:DUF2142 domain-containing protein [Agrococcus beijingensis]|uniref:DUF2142 domain-containing protein n=1 Tax=Agrococcus beijingensis TaxID=3068634 RepID=UPI0027408A46|nr:DUF2142 domain-containing protein [Agrococcus sp. REN33]